VRYQRLSLAYWSAILTYSKPSDLQPFSTASCLRPAISFTGRSLCTAATILQPYFRSDSMIGLEGN
jgi:hypothetical protein